MNTAPEAPASGHSLGLSVAFHAVLISLAFLFPRFLRLISSGAVPPIEVEITSPFLGDGPVKLGAPKPFVPGKTASVNVTGDKALVSVKPSPLKEWTLPVPGVKAASAPSSAQTGSTNGSGTSTTPGGAVGGEGTAAKAGGIGEGSDEGVVGGYGHGGTPLLAFPKLLNRDEVLANLRHYYPEAERIAGREADVIVVIHVGADGSVGVVDVKDSANPAFDAAAQKVAKLMRFAPAIGLNGQPVSVRLPQPIQFRLEN